MIYRKGATVIRYQQLYILRFIWPNGAEALSTYLPTGRYDCTAFMETGSVGLRYNPIGVLVNVNVESPAATPQQCFQKYLLAGGMPYPGDLRNKEDPCKQHLTDVFNSVQLKNVVKRYDKSDMSQDGIKHQNIRNFLTAQDWV